MISVCIMLISLVEYARANDTLLHRRGRLGLMVFLMGQLQHPNTLLQACFIIHVCCLISKISQLWKQQRLKEHVCGSAGKVYPVDVK